MMTTLLGANWRTTVTGWITVLASAIAMNPKLIAFLPEHVRESITGIAGLIAVVSGGTFAYAAKDKQVTGGNVPNDKGDSGRPLAGENTPALIIAASLSLLGFTACSWVAAHQQQWNATVRVVEQRALEVASRVLLAVATDEADKGFKADFLDSVAAGLRENGSTVVSSEDVEKIVKIWSPNDGTQWQTLAGQLGTVAADALARAGERNAATITEHIATGLNNAAASVRPPSR